MRCAHHPEVETEHLCATSGKGVCSECGTVSGNPELCPSCRLEELDEPNRVRRQQADHLWGTAFAIALTVTALAFLPDTELFFSLLKATWVGVIIGSFLRSVFDSKYRVYRFGILNLSLPLAYFATRIFSDWEFSPLWWLVFWVLMIPIIPTILRFQAKTAPLRNEYRSLRKFVKSLK